MRMKDQGMEFDGCPLGFMLAEHALPANILGRCSPRRRRMQSGDSSGQARAIESSRSYVALLRRHIRKEDNILFPMD